MDNFFTPKNALFFCKKCDYKCCKGSDWKRHIMTIKHTSGNKWITKDNTATPQQNQQKFHKCPICSNVYRFASGLSKHKKTCKPKFEDIKISNSSQITAELVMDVFKQNKELQEMLVEQNKAIVEMSKNFSNQINTFNNNSNNKTFNLNLFLNETCKNAMNMSEFVSSIKMNLDDLETTGRLGYAEGISSIILNNMKNIDSHMRPVHCTDLKREILYIKDNGVWEKDNEQKELLKKAIKAVAHKNIKQISLWQKKYPNCTDSESVKNDLYLKIVSNSMSGIDANETNKNIMKIISNVARGVIIDKHIT